MIILNNSSRLYIYGDYHRARMDLLTFLKPLKPTDIVIMVGDYEAPESSRLYELDLMFAEHGVNGYLLRGNHDNPVFWQNEKQREELNTDFTSIHLLDEVDALLWNNIKIVTVNGAVSVDRTSKRTTVHGNCWPETEKVCSDVVERVRELVEQHGDFTHLISHTSSKEGLPVAENSFFVRGYATFDTELLEDLAIEQSLLDSVLLVSGVTYTICGHFHVSNQSETFGIAHRCLNISESMEL